MVQSCKILVVDDEPSIVIPLQFLMEKNGYRVLTADNGEEAIRIAKTHRPDLILLDIMLPVRDGYEVCQAMREDPETCHAKIIFITAMGREVDLAKGRAYGADAYITKPFANADVLETVRRLLG